MVNLKKTKVFLKIAIQFSSMEREDFIERVSFETKYSNHYCWNLFPPQILQTKSNTCDQDTSDMGSAYDEELILQIRNNNQSQHILSFIFHGNKTYDVSSKSTFHFPYFQQKCHFLLTNYSILSKWVCFSGSWDPRS